MKRKSEPKASWKKPPRPFIHPYPKLIQQYGVIRAFHP